MPFSNKRQFFFIILTGFFVTNAIVAEVIGGKLIQLGPFLVARSVCINRPYQRVLWQTSR